MIFRQRFPVTPASGQPGVRPVWQAFLDTQKNIDPPYGIVLQADHAKLAGEIARGLLPVVFGELNPEVIDAIARHDVGWHSGDEAQIANMAKTPPKPFPQLPGEESMPFWRASVERARSRSALTGVVVSRHFCALAVQDPAHRPFIAEEQPRREAIERELGTSAEDLDRWTAAIGFCDIVSLYLCSGTHEPVELPLAHPALPDSRNARKVFLEWVNDRPRFSSSLLKPGATFAVTVQDRPDSSVKLEPRQCSWTFGE